MQPDQNTLLPVHGTTIGECTVHLDRRTASRLRQADFNRPEHVAGALAQLKRKNLSPPRKRGSLFTWQHVNMQEEYDFRRVAANNSVFDMGKILALRVA
jgi:hypothetical protein